MYEKRKILIFIFLISFIFVGFKAKQKFKKIDSTSNRSIQAKVTTNWNNTILESPWITFNSNKTKNLGSAGVGYGYYPGPTVLSLKTLQSHSSETNFNGEWIYDTY